MRKFWKHLQDYYWGVLIDKYFKNEEYQITLYFGLCWFWLGIDPFWLGYYEDGNLDMHYFQKGITFRVPFFKLNFVHHLNRRIG